MDGYQEEVAKKSGAPFTKPAERKVIRAASEHWLDRQRYSAEQKRRLANYGWWIGLGAPILLALVKVVEAFGK